MRFVHCSKYQIERLIPEDNVILISIAGMTDSFAQVDDSLYKDILRLRFDDVLRDFGHFKALTEDDCYSIITFINKNSSVDYAYINCEQGISRSAGIHMTLEKLYNSRNVYFENHNTHVRNLLLKVGIYTCRNEETSERIFRYKRR